MSEQNGELFGALKRGSWLDFFQVEEPKCPHCGHDISINDNELWNLYEEGHHEVSCPVCDEDFTVIATAKYSFSTDEQDEMED